MHPSVRLRRRSQFVDGLARHLILPLDAASDDDAPAYDDFRFLLLSATSAVAAPMLSAALHERLVAPLAERLGKRDAALRASLLVSQILGFSTLRFALGSPDIESTEAAKVVRRLAEALRACIAN